jgi:tetrahydromethanopterin S-methyltransferase subunit E
MHEVANLWWMWLIGAVVTLVYGGYNQVSRMRRMMNDAAPEKSFFKGMVALFVAAILNMGFVILLVVAIVLKVIDYAKQ